MRSSGKSLHRHPHRAGRQIKAFYNTCLHRGRKLVTLNGCKDEFRCPYHGIAWNTDGTFKDNPIGWDFPQWEGRDMSLPQAKVDTWGGFVFINFDPHAPPLIDADRRRWPSTSSATTIRTATRRSTSSKPCAATGRPWPRPSWRATTPSPPTRRSCRSWPTPTASTTSSTTSFRGSSRPAACPARSSTTRTTPTTEIIAAMTGTGRRPAPRRIHGKRERRCPRASRPGPSRPSSSAWRSGPRMATTIPRARTPSWSTPCSTTSGPT